MIVFPLQTAWADLNISSINSPVVVDFETTLAGVNNGAYVGDGFDPGATSVGRLDSNSWAISGNNGTLAFGGTQVTAGFARGYANGAVNDNGIWSFDTDNNGTLGDAHALGIQPTTAMSVFNPGDITLRVQNSTGATVSAWSLGYDVGAFNDRDRSNTVSLSFSTDGSTFTPVPAINYTSPQDEDATPQWVMENRSTSLSASVADGGNLFLRWTISFTGGGSTSQYDQLALDNMSVAAVPEPGAFLFGGLVCGVIGLGVGGRWLWAKVASRG